MPATVARGRTGPRPWLRLGVLNGAVLLTGLRLGFVGAFAERPTARLWVMVGAVVLVALNSALFWWQWRRAERDRVAAGLAAARALSPDFELVVGSCGSGRSGVEVTGHVVHGGTAVGRVVTVVRRGRARGSAGVVAVHEQADGTTAVTLTGIGRQDLLAGDLLLG